MSNYYEQSSTTTIEYAVLAEDLKFTKIKNLLGKFYITILTPEESTSTVSTTKKNKVETSNYVELPIPAYMLLQFMNPSNQYVTKTTVDGVSGLFKSATSSALSFLGFTEKEYTIKKGTKFLIGFLNGEMTLEKIQIIGISIAVDDEDDE